MLSSNTSAGKTVPFIKQAFSSAVLIALVLQNLLFAAPFAFSPPPPIGSSGGVIASLETAYTENFDALANTGTPAWADNSTLPGWYSSRTAYVPGTGSSTTGALYSFGSTGSTERALGSVGSGSTGTIYWGVKLKNN